MMRRPSTELIERLKALDNEFFGREFPPNSGKSLADGVFVLPGLVPVPRSRPCLFVQAQYPSPPTQTDRLTGSSGIAAS
jgi:hypothetical protein